MSDSLFDGKIDSSCLHCGKTFSHWRSASRTYCSKTCAYKHTGNKTHGFSGTPTHRTWKAMRWRCSPKNPYRANYFDRDIRVCKRWESFENFLEDMGEKPYTKATLDRIDNNGNYESNNCRWASMKQQANNTRRTNFVIVNGKKITLLEIADTTGISPETIRNRIKRGLSFEKITSRPVKSPTRERSTHGRFI